MKILKLRLENFAHIYSGLGKKVIDLDFSNVDKTINVIIGKMGSCKTVILGHMQPFANFGTTDIRNQDNIILPEMNGRKLLIIQHGPFNYIIEHKYVWSKTYHSVKSFIAKDGNELNPTGSPRNFKSLVELELGIDQSFLVLSRLGSNVTNLIDMKAADRKAYIASMLKGAEIYQMLFKKLNEDLRIMNSQAAMLIKKISNLSKDNLDGLKSESNELSRAIDTITRDISTTNFKIAECEANLRTKTNGLGIEAFVDELNTHKDEAAKMQSDIDDAIIHIESMKSRYKSITDVAKEIGSTENKLISNDEIYRLLSQDYDKMSADLAKYRETALMRGDRVQIASMKVSYENLVSQLDNMSRQLNGFNCTVQSSMIKGYMAQIDSINIIFNELADYDRDVVMSILKDGSGKVHWANSQIEICNKRKIKLQNMMNNFRYIGQYKPLEDLVFPEGCHNTKCPYYRTHPTVVQMSMKNTSIEDELKSMMDEIDKLDVQIAIYTDYPIIFNKLSMLRTIWYQVVDALEPLGVIKNRSLTKALYEVTSIWYDYDALMSVIEKCELREKYYTLSEQSAALRAELQNLSRFDDEDLDKKIIHFENRMKEIQDQLKLLEEDSKSLREKKAELEIIYLDLSKISDEEMKIERAKIDLESVHGVIRKMEESIADISDLSSRKTELGISLVNLNQSLVQRKNRHSEIQMILNDISYAQKEFDEIREAQEVLKYLVEAVSSNKGIPLVYIQLFLRNCKDTLNELIADVFGDSIEVSDFIINESEFRVPYTINGSMVEDISRASQGQKSVISLALSFALMQEAQSSWNIMLLDEMDGPLYKADREKFITILYKQMAAIEAEQVFLISHNFAFDGQSVNIIMTTDERVEKSDLINIMKV